MLETEIRMEPAVARKHYLDYRRLKEEQRTLEDEQIQRSYLELSRGHGILNAIKAIENSGFGPDGMPKLAFSRASAAVCYGQVSPWRVGFSDRNWPRSNYRSGVLDARFETSADYKRAQTVVPSIPPAHRPASALDRYWIMWEVAEGGWSETPTDPALLRRLNATTFSVLAVWDLTEVERMVLSSTGR